MCGAWGRHSEGVTSVCSVVCKVSVKCLTCDM